VSGAHGLFLDRFEAVVRAHADKVAVLTEGTQVLTYAELQTRSSRLGGVLRRRGVGPEKVVGLCLEKSADYVVALLGVWYAGGAFLPMDPAWPVARREFIAKDSGLSAILHEVREDKGILDSRCEPGPTDLAYVIYTSGSTGAPKGVLIEHKGVVNFLDAQVPRFGLRPGCRVLFYLSTSFDASVSDVGTALLSGATLCIERPEHLHPGLGLIELMRDRQITHVDIPPSVLSLLDPETLPPCLETVIIGGEPCPPEVVRRWARVVRVVNVYGPTEATVCTSLCLCDAESWNAPLLGQPIPNVSYHVLDESGHPVAPGTAGELCIGGVGLARGYLNRLALTARKFIVHDGARLYRTGDRIKLRSDGEYQFLGRVDRQVKVRGMLIEPEEIEAWLLMLPQIRQAAVVKRPLGRRSQEGLAAFLVARHPAPSAQQLRQQMAESLPRWMLPQRFEFLPRLPLNAHGKVDLADLAARELSVPSEAAAGLVGDARVLAEVVALVLGTGPVDVTDCFLDLGGDSLAALETVTAAAARGLLLSPTELLLKQPLEQLLRGQAAAMSADQLRGKLASDADWQNFLASARGQDEPTADPPRTILLTGATGFLGSHLLGELLRRTEAEICCLVRAEDEARGRQRILTALQGCEIQTSSEQQERIVAVPGNLEEPNLGLSPERWRQLAVRVDAIHHCAARVNGVLPYAALAASNVEGTRTILRLAATGRPKRLHYASTLSVFVATDQNVGALEESDDLRQMKIVYGGYAQTKWLAEMLVRQACRAIGPAAVYRLGLITGDSRTGVCSAADFLSLFCRGVAALGCVPDVVGDTLKVDVTPVDYAAAAMAWLALRTPPAPGPRTFHVANPVSLTLGNLIDALLAFGLPIQRLPQEQWRSLAAARAAHDSRPETSAAYLALCRALGVQSPAFARFRTLDLFQATGVKFAMANVEAGLVGSGIRCPPPDQTLLRTYLLRLFGKRP
jgi:amino acid adenylation domain-containing protein/thioester reductase-like protein